jgi:hypothetical protein
MALVYKYKSTIFTDSWLEKTFYYTLKGMVPLHGPCTGDNCVMENWGEQFNPQHCQIKVIITGASFRYQISLKSNLGEKAWPYTQKEMKLIYFPSTEIE